MRNRAEDGLGVSPSVLSSEGEEASSAEGVTEGTEEERMEGQFKELEVEGCYTLQMIQFVAEI